MVALEGDTAHPSITVDQEGYNREESAHMNEYIWNKSGRRVCIAQWLK